MDKRFSKPESAVHAKNQAVIDTGRSEVESGTFYHPYQQQSGTPQAPPKVNYDSVGPQTAWKTPYSGPAVPGSQIEGKGGGKMNNFMKKMKSGPLASDRGS